MSEGTPTKVVIHTHGPTITIEAHEPLDAVLAAALKAYDHAAANYRRPDEPPGLAHGVGFQGELRDTPPVQSSSMAWAPGPYQVQIPIGPQ